MSVRPAHRFRLRIEHPRRLHLSALIHRAAGLPGLTCSRLQGCLVDRVLTRDWLTVCCTTILSTLQSNHTDLCTMCCSTSVGYRLFKAFICSQTRRGGSWRVLDTVRNRKTIGTRTHGRGVSLLGGRCSSSTFIVTCLQRRLGDRVRLLLLLLYLPSDNCR